MNPYYVTMIGFVLMSFSGGWFGLSALLGIPGVSVIGAIGVILFGIGLCIVIYNLSKIKNIEVEVVDEK